LPRRSRGLVEGARVGDVRQFNESLATFFEVFVRKGTYLVLERCKALVYRTLLKRVATVEGTTNIKLEKASRGPCFLRAVFHYTAR